MLSYGVSPALQLQPGAGATQQQQIFCTNLANSTGVKYTSVLSRVCLCVTVQEGDILLYIKYKSSSVAALHAAGVWSSQPWPPAAGTPLPRGGGGRGAAARGRLVSELPAVAPAPVCGLSSGDII